MDGERSRDDDGTGEYVCAACERSFESETDLARHVRDVGLVD